jgi:hypothetical protein
MVNSKCVQESPNSPNPSRYISLHFPTACEPHSMGTDSLDTIELLMIYSKDKKELDRARNPRKGTCVAVKIDTHVSFAQ